MIPGFVNVCCKMFITRDSLFFPFSLYSLSFNYIIDVKVWQIYIILKINDEDFILILQLSMYFNVSVFGPQSRFEQIRKFEVSAL